MAGLFGSGLGLGFNQGLGQSVGKSVGENGFDENTATSLALLNAMRQQQEAGLQRTATPIGSIAQNLMPIFGALIMGKAMAQQAAEQQAQNAADNETNAAKLALTRAETGKNEADTKRIAAETAYRERLLNNPVIAQILGGQPGNAATDATGDTAPAGGSPVVDIQNNPAAQKFFNQMKEKYPGMSGEEMAALYDAKQGKTGGSSGAAPDSTLSGMKPKVTLGITGPGITYSSDVKSSERQKQDLEIANAAKDRTLQNEKALVQFRATMPKGMSDADMKTVAAGQSLTELLDQAPQVIASIPKDMTRSEYAKNMAKYQGRADAPVISNIVNAVTGGIINTDSDPRLDPVASYIGQVQSALASWSVQNQRGGIRMLQYLRDHFPNYADSPEQVKSKVDQLNKNSSYIKTQIQALNDQFHKAASVASDLPPEYGAQSQGGVVKMPWVDKNGKQHFMVIDPTSGTATSAD